MLIGRQRHKEGCQVGNWQKMEAGAYFVQGVISIPATMMSLFMTRKWNVASASMMTSLPWHVESNIIVLGTPAMLPFHSSISFCPTKQQWVKGGQGEMPCSEQKTGISRWEVFDIPQLRILDPNSQTERCSMFLLWKHQYLHLPIENLQLFIGY